MVNPQQIRRILEAGVSEKVNIRQVSDTIIIRRGNATQNGFENAKANLRSDPSVKIVESDAQEIVVTPNEDNNLVK